MFHIIKKSHETKKKSKTIIAYKHLPLAHEDVFRSSAKS